MNQSIHVSMHRVDYPEDSAAPVRVHLKTRTGKICYEQDRVDEFDFAVMQREVRRQTGVRIVNDDYVDYEIFRTDFLLSCLLSGYNQPK